MSKMWPPIKSIGYQLGNLDGTFFDFHISAFGWVKYNGGIKCYAPEKCSGLSKIKIVTIEPPFEQLQVCKFHACTLLLSNTESINANRCTKVVQQC